MSEAFDRAAARFASIHELDPRTEEGAPFAVRYHQRLAAWVDRRAPEASEAMRLAARCQHLRRWAISRDDHPSGRAGYRAWRSALARRTAEEVGTILTEVGYDEDTVARVRAFLLKQGLRHDEEVQAFEDAICLVFLETELEAFAGKHDDDKLTAILQKTWRKMSPAGHQLAREMAPTLSERARRLLAPIA